MGNMVDSLRARQIGPLPIFKTAQAQPDESQFENDFAKLAFMFLQDRAPAMMKYLLGFETVERAEDGSRAVGMFGFKIGKDFYYVPAFFMNNQVLGVDTMLCKRTNMFIPLTEEWINYILKRKTVELGGPADDEVRRDFESPDFDFLQVPKVGPLGEPKFASADDETWSLSDPWIVMKQATHDMSENDPDFIDAFDGAISKLEGKSVKRASSADSIKKYVNEIGGPQAEDCLFNSLSNIKSATAALTFYDSIDAFYTDDFSKDCYQLVREKRASAPSIVVTDRPSTESEARDVLLRGFTIRDSRSEKSAAVDTTSVDSIYNPTDSGVYDIVMADGIKEGLVLRQVPFASVFNGPRCANAVVIFGTGLPVSTSMRNIFVVGQRKSDAATRYESAPGVYSMDLDSSYVLFNQDGTCFGPFNPRYSVSGNGRPSAVGTVSPINTQGDNDMSSTWDRYGLPESWYGDVTVEFGDFKGTPKYAGNGTVVMPDNWHVIKVQREWDDGASKIKNVLGSPSVVEGMLQTNGIHKIAVCSNDGGLSYFFRFDGMAPTSPMDEKKASIELVTRYGFGPEDAYALLGKAASDKNTVLSFEFPSSMLGKTAQFVGVDMPQPVEQTPTFDPYTGTPTYSMPYVDETQGSFTNVPELPGDNVQGENIGGEMELNSGSGEPTIDEEAMQLVQQAAESGQKKVFDQATIGGLSRVYDTSAVVDSYIPQFMSTLDRLGRILFLFNWKRDAFTERYGTDDVAELDDTMRGVFKSLGKLTLKLKEKSIGPEDSDIVAM